MTAFFVSVVMLHSAEFFQRVNVFNQTSEAVAAWLCGVIF